MENRNNFSTNNDTTLFFNCFTDEISSVTENGIEKRWKIDLGDEKADNRYFLNDANSTNKCNGIVGLR